MHEILGSASYVRNGAVVRERGGEQAVLQSMRQEAGELPQPEAPGRIWDLLETPQTIETICRVLENELDVPPASCVHGVKAVLSKLYREDLIQLSPDT